MECPYPKLASFILDILISEGRTDFKPDPATWNWDIVDAKSLAATERYLTYLDLPTTRKRNLDAQQAWDEADRMYAKGEYPDNMEAALEDWTADVQDGDFGLWGNHASV